MRRKPRTYNETHKVIDGIEHKLCSDFEEWYPLNENYFYKNKSAPDGFNPYCKKAAKERALKRFEDNREQDNLRRKQWYEENKEHTLKRQKVSNSNNKDNNKINQSKWRKENKDKLRQYQIERNMHKKHDIDDYELNKLYEYASSSCMYCGLSEDEHKRLFGQKLHKDHAMNYGSDGIDNCILACKSCNSSKHDKDWYEWYTSDLEQFNMDRYVAIKIWLGLWLD